MDEKSGAQALDNRSFKIGTETTFRIAGIVSIGLFADYQYRKYTPFNRNSRVSDNISVLSSVNVVF
jgi:hypothetical protein